MEKGTEMKHLLFVCTGNTCRSPMAEALAKARLPKTWSVESAGLFADGSPIASHALAALSERGIQADGYQSKQLTQGLCEQADCIVCMTPSHREALLAAGIAPSKIRLLGGGIPDPFGGSLDDYRACRDAIDTALGPLLEELTNADS